MPATHRTPGSFAGVGTFFFSEQLDVGFAGHDGQPATVPASQAGFSLQHVGGADTDGSGTGSDSEQQDFFFGVAGRDLRDSTRGRTCPGGSTPFASAQVSFSSMVKQQQSPFQHWSEVRHPHGRDWHG